MESHHSQTMQNFLHSTSPVEGDQDTLQPQSPTLNETYIALHNSADIHFNSWSPFTPHSRTSELQEKVDTLGELRLPQDTAMDNSSPIARFVNDSSSTRPLVELSNLSSLGDELHSHAHNTHLPIATGWNYQGSYHGEQYHDSADASSVVSSSYCQNSTEDFWTGSPRGNHYEDVNYDTAGTSPSIHQGHSHGGSHSNRSSTDGIGCLSSSPVMDQARNWRRDSEFSADSNADITSAVAPLTVTSDHRLSQDSTFVSLKSIQIRTANEGKDDDDPTHGQEGLAGCRPHSNSIPGIYVNGHEHSVHKHEHEHEHEHTSHWSLDNQYYILAPMEVECSASSSNSSPQALSRSAVMLEVKRERRRQRGSSRALQLSAKARSELMKPYKDTAISTTGKSHKGRGVGKKTKEKQHCPEHPNKVFRHNSDFRKHMQTKHTRPFLCTFYFADCHQTFGSKNEWKRHVYSQHLQLLYWRCDLPECADRKAYFNRKDLFGQHLKRMHFEKSGTYKTPQEKAWLSQDIPEIQDRCCKLRRTPPERSACGYCGKEFIGAGSWDTRMEHVGKHYEKNNYKDIDTGAWVMDKGLIDWAIKENIIEKTENGGYKLQPHGKDSIGVEEKEMGVSKMAIDDEDLENAYEEDAECEDDDIGEY